VAPPNAPEDFKKYRRFMKSKINDFYVRCRRFFINDSR